jgi:hypothetical protein
VLLLIDEHMVADAAWRYWVGQLNSGVNPSRICIPVALDATAFNVPPTLRELNFLRPTGLPLPAAWKNSRCAAVEVVVRSLLKQLTESMCRLMLGKREPPAARNPATLTPADEGQPKITIFLSHAKVDGTAPARRIRNYIYSQTQLAAFYDENDIPFGSAFSRVLKSSLHGAQTAAMIVVRSAAYAGRPWCRRELSLFRRPVQLNASPVRWRLNPTIVVDAVEGGGQTAGIPELGNAPLIRWADEIKDQEEQVVTTVLRDAMLAAFHIAVGGTIQETADRLILNWRPDPTTLLHIPRVRGTDKLRVYYPGRLSGLELDILEELFTSLTFVGFETATS